MSAIIYTIIVAALIVYGMRDNYRAGLSADRN